MHACIKLTNMAHYPSWRVLRRSTSMGKIISTCTISVKRPFDVHEMFLHLVIETSFSKSALIVCLKLVGDGDVKIPLLLLVWFACQEACHLFVLLDSQYISEIEHSLLPVSVLAMRTSRERYWLVTCGELDVKPSNQGVYEVNPPHVQDVRGLKCKIGRGNGVKID